MVHNAMPEREQYDRACRMVANCAKRAQEAKRNHEREFYIRVGDDWLRLAKRIASSSNAAPLPPGPSAQTGTQLPLIASEPWPGAAQALLPSPTLSERCHRNLACRGIAVRWCAVFVMPEGERPHPRASDRRRLHLEDAADDSAIGKYVEVAVLPRT
jgi:hypothetical protein